jgi:hypothetical protein
MSISRDSLMAKGKQLAQSGVALAGIQLLLTEPDDYYQAIIQATYQFAIDRPNRRTKDVTLASASFRYVLGGSGTILPSSGFDAWVKGGSLLEAVYYPFDSTAQGMEGLDENDWRVLDAPASSGALPDEVLELLGSVGAVGKILRLVYRVPHTIDNTDPTLSTVRPADTTALVTLTGAWILMLAANKAVQNTGSTGLPNDVVDRRSQSDIFKTRAKDLFSQYQTLVGSGGDTPPASGSKDLDVPTSYRGGMLWHPFATH